MTGLTARHSWGHSLTSGLRTACESGAAPDTPKQTWACHRTWRQITSPCHPCDAINTPLCLKVKDDLAEESGGNVLGNGVFYMDVRCGGTLIEDTLGRIRKQRAFQVVFELKAVGIRARSSG